MLVADQLYNVSFTDINAIRYALFHSIYNETSIAILKDIITKHIDCVDIAFNPTFYSFIVRVDTHNPEVRFVNSNREAIMSYFNNVMISVFTEFLRTPSIFQSLLSALKDKYTDPRNLLSKIFENNGLLSILSQITYIDNNVISIRL